MKVTKVLGSCTVVMEGTPQDIKEYEKEVSIKDIVCSIQVDGKEIAKNVAVEMDKALYRERLRGR